MKPFKRGWRRFLGSLAGRRGESDLAAEVASHIEMQEQDNRRAGMSPEEARRAAKMKFGNVESTKESIREQRGLPWLAALFTDLRYALRALRKDPGFTTVTVLTLALGIGANTAVFSLVDQVLLRPPGIANPERIVTVQTRYAKLNLEFVGASSRTLADLLEDRRVFEHAALESGVDLNYTTGGDPQRLFGAAVTTEWFAVFGARPVLGRVFAAEEDQPNANRVVVLSYDAWTRLFGGDRSVAGKTMELNQVPHRIVGVMPPEFRWPWGVDVWVPAGLPKEAFAPRQRFNENYKVVARTKRGLSFRAADGWMRLLTDRVHNGGGPGASIAKNGAWGLSVVPFVEATAGATRMPLLVLFGAVGVVLLIVCSNVAGLLLAKGSARAQEFAVRAALGAGPGQLLRAVLAESMLLATAGAVAGMALAYAGVNGLLVLAPQDTVVGLHPHLDTRVLLFCVAAAMAAAVLSGIAPAWQIARVGPNGALKGDDRAATVGQTRQKMRSALVVAETALALMLLVMGGLFLRSFLQLERVKPGFEPHGVMTAMFWLPHQTYPTGREQAVFYRTLLQRLSNSGGVAEAAVGIAPPFSGGNSAGNFQIEGRPVGPDEADPHGNYRMVTPGYFAALGIPLMRGRAFTDEDRITSEKVAVIDENLARQYWPGEDAIGKRIRKGDFYRIVGVVGHVMHSNLAGDGAKGVYYFSLFQQASPVAWILVKTRGDVALMPAVIRDAVREADPRQAVHSFRSMEEAVANSLAPRRFAMRLVGFFAATALFLAALGLYGVISYSVSQRKREIGIRIALGAERRGVIALVVGNGLRLAGIGAAIGVLGSIGGARLIQNQLFQVSPFDPLTIAGMAAILLIAALVASALPARRAMRVDPVVALRQE